MIKYSVLVLNQNYKSLISVPTTHNIIPFCFKEPTNPMIWFAPKRGTTAINEYITPRSALSISMDPNEVAILEIMSRNPVGCEYTLE